MRKGELSKIIIKTKYGFGRKENVDKLKFPTGYEVEGSAERTRLLTKTIAYEVKLFDWVERNDIEGDGNFLKSFVFKPVRKNDHSKPTDIDEVILNIKIH